MHFVRHGQHRLVITDFPYSAIWALLIFPAILGLPISAAIFEGYLLAAGAWGLGWAALYVGIVVTVRSNRYVFDRRASLLFWRRRGLFRRESGAIPFGDLVVQELERVKIKNGEFFRLALLVRGDRMTLYESIRHDRLETIRSEIAAIVRPAGDPSA